MAEFIPIVTQALDTYVPNEINTFRSLFQYLMELATRQSFNLVIGEMIYFMVRDNSPFTDEGKKLLVINTQHELLAAKAEHLKNKLLSKYQINPVCLSLEDM